jgi:hypothetical protein
LKKPAAIALAAAGIAISGAFVAVQEWRKRDALARGEQLLATGLGAAAADLLDPFREKLTDSPRGCLVLLEAYFEARHLPRLKWASQSCAAAGVLIPEVYLYAARVKALEGAPGEALDTLLGGLEKIGPKAVLYIEVIELLTRAGRAGEALALLRKYQGRLSDDRRFQGYALRFLAARKLWKEARAAAAHLELQDPGLNPELRMTGALALFHTGERPGAKDLARKILAEALRTRISDVRLQALGEMSEPILGKRRVVRAQAVSPPSP